MRCFLVLVLFFFIGCSSTPLIIPSTPALVGDVKHFSPSKNNKYALILQGQNSTCNSNSFKNDELDQLSRPILDPYIERDVSETLKLAASKDYSCYLLKSVEDFDLIIASLEIAANSSTQILIAMSGEGDPTGFIFNLVHLSNGPNLVPPGKKLLSTYFSQQLHKILGRKAIVINACQSGCFVADLQKDNKFQGVIISACAVGYATTNCEKTQTSAIYAGFLGLYQEDPKIIKNLATVSISSGHWFENLRHKLSDIGAGGLPISYDPIVYSTAEFLF